MRIIYEDQNYIGFFKPSGIPTTYGSQTECFIKEIKESHPKLFTFAGFKPEEGGLLYRLDNETSGLVLFAKNESAYKKFIQDASLRKIYLAEVSDNIPNEGIIDFPIAHKSSKKMATLISGKKIDYKGKPIKSKTYYKKIGENIIECEIQKGARHQIRVHLASIGCPIVGDELYKGKHSDPMHLCCIGIETEWLKIDIRKEIGEEIEWI